jgi:hypothetical protein
MKTSNTSVIRSLVLLLLVAVSLMGRGMLCAQSIPAPSGLVGWWQGEGNVYDVTGTNNGIAQNTTYSNGVVGQAFVFNGSSSQVRIPASSNLNVGLGGGLTIETWVNPASTSFQELCEWNLNDGNGVGAAQIGTHMEINEAPGDGSFWGGVVDTTGIAHNLNSTNGLITTNSFQHLAMTYDKASGVAALYRNGVAVAVTNLGVFTPQTSFDFFLGNRPSGFFTGNYFQGKMDEVSVYNRALSGSEIQSIYNAGSAGKTPIFTAPVISTQPSNQIVQVGDTATFNVTVSGSAPFRYQWSVNGTNIINGTNASFSRFNVQTSQGGNYRVVVTNNAGSVVSSNALLTVNIPPGITQPAGIVSWWPAESNANDIISGNHGIAQNITYANGEAGQAFVFNGSSSQIRVPASASLNVGLGGGLTIETWVNPERNSFQELCEWNQNNGVSSGAAQIGTHMEINEAPGDGSFWGGLVDTSGISHNLNSTNGLITTNSFQHLAMTYDKASGVAALYRNGVAVAVTNLGVFTPQTSFDFFLGNRPSGVFTGNFFQGKMDEVSVYNRALSSSEIQVIYSAGSAGKVIPSGVPVIVSTSPTGGIVGTNVVLTGNNFSPITASNIVYFGAVRATVVSASLTSLTVTVPVGATFSPITVTVNGLTAYSPISFSPTAAGDGSGFVSSSFTPRLDLATGTGPGPVVIADLDGDGKPDLIIPDDYAGDISIYRNISSTGSLTAGSFAPRVILPMVVGSYDNPDSLAIADLDGDGRLDIVAINADSKIVSILKNISSPGSITTNSFAPRVDLAAGTTMRGLAVRDLDGDGRPEIVTGNYGDNSISIFPNVGTTGIITSNSFAARIDFATGSGPCGVAVGDLDGDGKPDIAVANFNGNTISVFRNLGAGAGITASSFAVKMDYPAPATVQHIAIGDLDGDGKPDMVVGGTSASQVIAVYRNTSIPGSINTNSFAPEIDFPAGGWVGGVSIGDLDGDGKLDIVASAQSPDHLSIFKNISTPGSFTNTSLASRVDYATGSHPNGPAIGDLDGDGRPELVFDNQYGTTLSIYPNAIPFAGLPVILAQPASQTIASGNNAVFSVNASGSATLAYQWWFGGPIAGATNANLALTNVQLSNSGSYFVVVTNVYGSATSSVAVLTVTNQSPFIVSQPQSNNIVVGFGVTFSVSAGGSKPFSYQWRFNGTNIIGATSSNYTIAAVQTTNAGAYSVVVANPFSSVTSSNAALTVTVLPTTVADDFEPGIDTSQWSAFGGTVLATNYGGFVSPSNSLWFGGTGSRFATTRLLNTVAGGPIEFYIRLASGTSATWETVDSTSKGIVLEYSTNQGAIWTTIAQYNPPIYTNWTAVSTNMPVGAKAPATLFRWRQLSNSGSTSDHWALDDVYVGPRPPQITTQPANQTVAAGQSAAFTVAVTGTAPFGYQWRSNSVNIAGATNTSLTLANVQLAQSGSTYSVVVTNSAGSVTSSNALLTVNLPPATIQVVNTNVLGGTTVAVPVIFVANGNENALSFSLNFDTTRLVYSDIALSSTVPGDASFLPSTGQPGKIGVSLLLPAGHTFTAGTQEIVRVIFNAPILTGTQTVATAVSFTNVPISKLLSDVNVQPLPASFIDGTVSVYPGALEGDVIGRPAGDGFVNIFDWQQIGRFVAGLDTITNAGEFQRVDCAPRSSLGDGKIKVNDWVQAGRYAAGLDPLSLAGGPTAPVPGVTAQVAGSSGVVRPNGAGARQVSVADGAVVQGLTLTLPVNITSQGDESALAFSLSFDPAILRYVSAAKGSAASSSTFNVNANLAGSGQLAIALMLPAGSSHFTAGIQEVAKVTFVALATATNYSLGFADQPALRSISDTNAAELAANYTGNSVTINPSPSLNISQTGANILLSWPVWAGDFTLQTADISTSPVTWSDVVSTVQTNGANIELTLPVSAERSFFRLQHP